MARFRTPVGHFFGIDAYNASHCQLVDRANTDRLHRHCIQDHPNGKADDNNCNAPRRQDFKKISFPRSTCIPFVRHDIPRDQRSTVNHHARVKSSGVNATSLK